MNSGVISNIASTVTKTVRSSQNFSSFFFLIDQQPELMYFFLFPTRKQDDNVVFPLYYSLILLIGSSDCPVFFSQVVY